MPHVFLFVALLIAQPAQPATPQWEEEDQLATRYGAVLLEKIADDIAPRWRVTFNGRTLAETEDDELGLWELFEGDDGHDFVIFRRSSGGIACPYQFRVVEAAPNGQVFLTDEFGSCLDPKRTQLYGNALVLEMDSHIPHPDLLTAQEIRKLKQTTSIFTVRAGKVTQRSEIRK